MSQLVSYAEREADAATKLPSFPVHLGEVKRSVAEILSQFGKGLMFHGTQLMTFLT